jgi:ABC-2 type transport system ATP-binding protein
VWAEIEGLAAAGTTVLLTTQYLEEADRLAARVVIVDAGRVVARGTPDELKDALGSRVDVVVTGADQLAGAAGALSGWAGDVAEDRDGLRVTAAVTGAVTLPEVVRCLDTAGVSVRDVALRRPTLDEVFLDRVGVAA